MQHVQIMQHRIKWPELGQFTMHRNNTINMSVDIICIMARNCYLKVVLFVYMEMRC